MARRRIKGLRVVLLLVIGIVVMGKAPGAWACSCAYGDFEAEFERSDLVFTGSPVSRVDPNEGAPFQSSIDPVHWTFDVASTEKGTTTTSQVVSSARESASCGYTFEIGKRYQVFATRQGVAYTTGLCTGTHELAVAETPLDNSATTWLAFPITVLALAVAGAFAIVVDLLRTRTRSS